MIFEDILVQEYLKSIHTRSFCEWVEFKLGELNFVVESTKDTRARGDMGGVTVQWTTKISYEGDVVAIEQIKFSEELTSVSEAISLLLCNKKVPEELRTKVREIQRLILVYALYSWCDDVERLAKELAKELKKYDSDEPDEECPSTIYDV